MTNSMILGYTRSGHPVHLPPPQKPDMERFPDWTPGDHLDASRILVEHGERANENVGPWCEQWAKAHLEIGKKEKRRQKKARLAQIRGAAEVVIRSPRRR